MQRNNAPRTELERWYRRSSEDIEAEKNARWNRAWAGLRTPEHLARQPDTLSGGAGADQLAGGSGGDRIAAGRTPTATPVRAPATPAHPHARRVEPYERGPDGKLRFTPEYQKQACRNYDALMKAQEDINFWTSWEGVPAFFKKETGPLGLMISGPGLLTGLLGRSKPPPGCK